MAKIYIRGEKGFTKVTQEEAEKILSQKDDANYKGMVSVGPRKIQKGLIKEVSFNDEGVIVGYNLNDLADKEKVLEFERFCEELKTGMLDRSLEWYGFPMDQERFPGLVTNPVLGGVHWSLVKWAIENGAIVKRQGRGGLDYWAIRDYGKDGKWDTGPFDDLMAKLIALSTLRSKRAYAQTKTIDVRTTNSPPEEHVPLEFDLTIN